MRTALALAALAVLATLAAAEPTMTASSAAFPDLGRIPVRHTCLGEEVSPALVVRNVPAGTVSIALIMADPDAPASALAPLGLLNFTHWLVWNVPVPDRAAAWPEGALPAGAVQGASYAGPCPPVPLDPHHYILTFHALDATLSLGAGADRADLEAAMDGHVLARTALTGVFARGWGALPAP